VSSISFKLVVWYAASVALTAAVFMFGGQAVLERRLIEGIDELNELEFEEIRPQVEGAMAKGGESAIIHAIRDEIEMDAPLFFFQIRNDRDETFYASANLTGRMLPDLPAGQSSATKRLPGLGALRMSEFAVGEYDLFIASSLQGLEILRDKWRRTSAGLLAALFAVSLAVGYLLSRLAMRPIARIERTASRISARKLDERIEVSNANDEITRLARLLNRMFDRLQVSFDQMRHFAADASHELKTPLALARLRLEDLQRSEPGLSQAGREALVAQIDEVTRLGSLIDDLLDLAKSEAGSLPLDLARRPAAPFLLEFKEDAEALCEDRGLRFRFDGRFLGEARFDPTWLRRVLFNLLANAMKFAPASSTVRLASRLRQGRWELVFDDEGPGVDADKRERIFDRFYSEGQKDGAEKGAGLGLALVRSIVLLHGGDVEARERPGGPGLRVVVRLPVD